MFLASESYTDPVIGPNDVPGGEKIKTITFHKGLKFK